MSNFYGKILFDREGCEYWHDFETEAEARAYVLGAIQGIQCAGPEDDCHTVCYDQIEPKDIEEVQQDKAVTVDWNKWEQNSKKEELANKHAGTRMHLSMDRIDACKHDFLAGYDEANSPTGKGERALFIEAQAKLITTLQAELEALKDKEFFLTIIREWKHAWMNQHQNSEADFKNYLTRAFGIDANMQHNLAFKIVEKINALVRELK
jgi:hypothetical protein